MIEKKVTVQIEQRRASYFVSEFKGDIPSIDLAFVFANRHMETAGENVTAIQICEDQRVIHRWERQDDLSWDKVI